MWNELLQGKEGKYGFPCGSLSIVVVMGILCLGISVGSALFLSVRIEAYFHSTATAGTQFKLEQLPTIFYFV